jgi:hypothetical protein
VDARSKAARVPQGGLLHARISRANDTDRATVGLRSRRIAVIRIRAASGVREEWGSTHGDQGVAAARDWRTVAGSTAVISIGLHAASSAGRWNVFTMFRQSVATSTGESFAKNRAARPTDSSRSSAAGTARASSSQMRRTTAATSARGKSTGHHQHAFAEPAHQSRARHASNSARSVKSTAFAFAGTKPRAGRAAPRTSASNASGRRSIRGSETVSRRTQRIASLPRREAPAPLARAVSTRWLAKRGFASPPRKRRRRMQ